MSVNWSEPLPPVMISSPPLGEKSSFVLLPVKVSLLGVPIKNSIFVNVEVPNVVDKFIVPELLSILRPCDPLWS